MSYNISDSVYFKVRNNRQIIKAAEETKTEEKENSGILIQESTSSTTNEAEQKIEYSLDFTEFLPET